MNLTPIQTPLIERHERLVDVLQATLPRCLQEGDIICVASKVVSMEQGRVIDLTSVRPSPAAIALGTPAGSKDTPTRGALNELILREADRVFKTPFVWLTLKGGMFLANAGIDLSNVPEGFAVLWPEDPWGWAHDFRQELQRIYDVRGLGIIVTDGRTIPLRRGFIGVAVAYSGFEGVVNQKGKPDLFGRQLQFTEKTVADGLAAAAVIVGGEADESTPFVLIEGAPVTFTDRVASSDEIVMPPELDLFAPVFVQQVHGSELHQEE